MSGWRPGWVLAGPALEQLKDLPAGDRAPLAGQCLSPPACLGAGTSPTAAGSQGHPRLLCKRRPAKARRDWL